MNRAQDIHTLVEEVVAESRLPARKREELRKELASHVWELGSELKKQGMTEEEIPAAIKARFGAPKKIGRAFSFIYGSFLMRLLKPCLMILGALLFVFLAWPPRASFAEGKYYTFLYETFGDGAWYDRAMVLAAAKEQGVEPGNVRCKYNLELTEAVIDVPFGNILTRCNERWLIFKMLPPIQISGPRVSAGDVVEAMRQAGALRNYHSIFNADPLNQGAALTLESYLESLALGAGHTKTKRAILNYSSASGLEELPLYLDHGLSQEEKVEMMNKGLSEMRGFPTAVLYWAGDVKQLHEWNPDVASDDLAKLLETACARQIQCLMPVKIEIVSIVKKPDSAVVTLRAFLDSSDETIANHPFLFEVTRFDIGVKNDWTDDEYNVTKGFAYLP